MRAKPVSHLESSGIRSEGSVTDLLSTSSLFLTLITTGLSAGFFYAWQVGSIPGLRLLDNATYIQTMNAVNSTIRNFGFGFIFFGSAVFLGLALMVRAKQWRSLSFGLLAASLFVYVLGLLGITFGIHVPMNTELLTHTDLTTIDVAVVRSSYETRWNTWHLVRTCAGVASFMLLLAAAFVERRRPKPQP